MAHLNQDVIINKRLHISGITPSVTASDISSRLRSFGEVKAVDGVGLLDGTGQPRKFAYLTLETTQPKLVRCLNLLNGSTWKGAKLRIGEAKPDYRERLAQERGEPSLKRSALMELPDASQKKRRKQKPKWLPRGVQGREVQDMKSTTLQNVQYRKGWKRTALDHLIHPIRMRPAHPLPPIQTSRTSTQLKTLKTKSSKKKERAPLVRARRTVIDPTRYGAIHITAASGLLGAQVIGAEADKDRAANEDEESSESSSADEQEVEQSASEHNEEAESHKEQPSETATAVHIKSLKEMFAPQEEKAGFSLVGNLDVDLELDEDMEKEFITPLKPATPAVQQREPTPTLQVSENIVFDPSTPFFFMLPRDSDGQLDLLGGSWSGRKGGKPKDVIDVLNADISLKFWRTENEDEIRQRWDNVKGDLTREYKKRHREAFKRKRKVSTGRSKGLNDVEDI
ncbi:hypothetical protein FRC02_008797 [Tulasnella sp. 418]|nr:hypothetical protein FRC02_008797 [Tulasnella sp. 418]